LPTYRFFHQIVNNIHITFLKWMKELFVTIENNATKCYKIKFDFIIGIKKSDTQYFDLTLSHATLNR